jgi:predicted enzyme related to lactoylglutathione lyase
MSTTPKMGTIGWIDLTVPDADAIRDFYSAVAGWAPSPVPMGGYDDYANAGLPAQWLVYITVPDVDAAAAACRERGGDVLIAPKDAGGYGRYCVIRDPAGAVAALFTPAAGA